MCAETDQVPPRGGGKGREGGERGEVGGRGRGGREGGREGSGGKGKGREGGVGEEEGLVHCKLPEVVIYSCHCIVTYDL